MSLNISADNVCDNYNEFNNEINALKSSNESITNYINNVKQCVSFNTYTPEMDPNFTTATEAETTYHHTVSLGGFFTDSAAIRMVSVPKTPDQIELQLCVSDDHDSAIIAKKLDNFTGPRRPMCLLDHDDSTKIPYKLCVYDSATEKYVDVLATLKAIAADKLVYAT